MEREATLGADGAFQLECEPAADLREAVFHTAVARGWVLLELAQVKTSLEDLFVRLTTREGVSEAPEAPATPAAEVVS